MYIIIYVKDILGIKRYAMSTKDTKPQKIITPMCLIIAIIFCLAMFLYVEEVEAKEVNSTRIDISRYDVKMTKSVFEYSGTAIKPEITIRGLKRKTDYLIKYKDNVKPGTASVVISGIGKYRGQKVVRFIIKPYAPKDLKAILVGHDDVKLTWKSVPGSTGYFIYYKRAASSQYTFLKKTTGCTLLADDLKDHVTYCFKVVPYVKSDLSGKVYKASKASSTKIMTKKYIEAPSVVKTRLYGHDDVKVTWSKVEGVSGYNVYCKRNGQKEYTFLGKTTGRSFVKENLKDGVEYIFRVKPRYKVGSKYYIGYYGRNSSVYTLKKPEIDIDRIGFTKIEVVWKDIKGEVGYQVSKSTNWYNTDIIYTNKVATGGSKRITAPLEKRYYYQVRAYTVTDGKKIYGPWSDRFVYTLDDHYYPKAVKTTKNGKVVEIRTAAGQKVYEYDTVQGSCTDGKYGYYVLYNRNVEKCKLVKMRISDSKVMAVSKSLAIHHGNDLAYNDSTNEIAAVHMTGRSKTVAIIDPVTLKLKRNVDIMIPDTLPGANSFKLNRITGFNAIAYDQKSSKYVLRIRNTGDYLITDRNLHPIGYVVPKTRKHKDSIYAGLDIINGYIASSQYAGTSGGYNLVQLHDWSGKYIGTININKSYELESTFNMKNKVYASYYRSYYSAGKLNRSNYIYKFDF